MLWNGESRYIPMIFSSILRTRTYNAAILHSLENCASLVIIHHSSLICTEKKKVLERHMSCAMHETKLFNVNPMFNGTKLYNNVRVS